jgi:hypothetical protein
MGRAATLAIAVAFAAPAFAADKAGIRASLDAAISAYEACNRAAMEEVKDREGRSLGWKAVYAEGTCLHMLEPVNAHMLELYVPDVTFYRIQNLRTTTLRKNMEQIHTPGVP